MGGRENEVFLVINETALLLGIGAPKHENKMLLSFIELAYYAVGKSLPALICMRPRVPRFHGEDRIEQEDSLPCPGL